MKYLTTFEKLKLHDKRRMSPYLSEFIPGYFIIYNYETYDWKIKKSVKQLILAQIKNIEDKLTYSSGEANRVETYLDIKIIDIINEYNIEKFDKGYYTANLMKENIIFKSPSYATTLKEFEKLKEDEPYKSWIITNNMNKYNI